MRIDHKDEPGEHRTAVFKYVQEYIGFKGEAPLDPKVFIGDWVYRHYVSTLPFAFQSFSADGSAPARAVDGTFESAKDRWKLNDDGSFSLWGYVEPMPEYGIAEATYSEDRYHVLMNGSEEFILFNGDGSIILVYSKRANS